MCRHHRSQHTRVQGLGTSRITRLPDPSSRPGWATTPRDQSGKCIQESLQSRVFPLVRIPAKVLNHRLDEQHSSSPSYHPCGLHVSKATSFVRQPRNPAPSRKRETGDVSSAAISWPQSVMAGVAVRPKMQSRGSGTDFRADSHAVATPGRPSPRDAAAVEAPGASLQ